MPLRAARFSKKKGFTLIELLVVMAIMVIVTGIMLVNQSKFDSSTIMRSLAYSIALSMRQAQVYGVSVLGTSTPSGITYASAYGVYFNATNNQYILFADLDNNGRYTSGEDVKVFTLGTGYYINKFCATTSGTLIQRCWIYGDATDSSLASLSILFKRPNPDACFSTDVGPTACQTPSSGETYTSALIQIQNQGDTASTHTITVTSTGLISVQ